MSPGALHEHSQRIGSRVVVRLPLTATRSGAHRLVRNGALNLAAQAIYAVFYLAAIASMARGLGKAAFGVYYTQFALLLVVQLVCEAGLGTVLTRRIARARQAWQSIAAEAAGLFSLSALASVAAFATIGFIWCRLSEQASLWPCFAATALACAAMQVQKYCASVLGGFERFGYENAARILQGASLAVLAIGLTMKEESRPSTVMLALAASYCAAALFLVISLRRLGPFGWRLSPAVLRDWLSESVPLGLGDVLRGLVFQVDTLLLGLLQSAAVVGVYSVAYRLLGPINWVPLAILTAIFPAFARAAGADREGLDRTFGTSVRLLWIAALPIAVSFCVCAEPIVRLLAGPEYLEAARPMRVVIWIVCLTFVSYPFRFLFTALGHPRLFAALVALGLGIQIGTELWLVPRWSYWGSCTGSVLAEGVFAAMGLYLCRRLGVSGVAWAGLGRALLAAAVMAALLWPLRAEPMMLLAPAVAAAGVVYLMLCVRLGALRPGEVRRFCEACRGSRTSS